MFGACHSSTRQLLTVALPGNKLRGVQSLLRKIEENRNQNILLVGHKYIPFVEQGQGRQRPWPVTRSRQAVDRGQRGARPSRYLSEAVVYKSSSF